MKVRHKIFFSLISFLTFQGNAQDIHFSQFNGSLLNLSPGYTGMFNGDYRVGAIYRSQWQTVPVKYNTFSMQGEKRFQPMRFEKDMIGLGLTFNNDRAGDASYGTTQIYLNGSYLYFGQKDTTLLVTLGASLGWCQVGFDYTRMTFGSQYDGFQYNPALSTNEQFTWTRRNFADISIGSVIRKTFNLRHRVAYAIGVHHLTAPRISYQGNDESRLDRRITNCVSYNTPLNRHLDIIGEVLLHIQGRNYELIPHASLKIYFDKQDNKAVLGGVCFRARDAVVARLGYTHKTLQSGISYDINVSGFNAATNRRGGFEIFVNYIIQMKPGFIARKRPCPVFI